MATLPPSITFKQPASGGGRGDIRPPISGGGEDNRSYGGSPDYGSRMHRARLGLLIALVPITSLFICMTAAYMLRHNSYSVDIHTGARINNWIHIHLPLRWLIVSTVLILFSSFTMEIARRKNAQESALAPIRSIPGIFIERSKGFSWLTVTLFLGLGFLTSQWIAWRDLAAHGFYVGSTVSSAFFYFLTAAHALHLGGGLFGLIYAQILFFRNKPLEYRHIVIDITSWYWHFLALLWVCIFALLYCVH